MPRRFLRQLEIGTGTVSSVEQGARIGGLIGAAILGVSWAAATPPNDLFPPAVTGLIGAALGGTAGGLVGATVGAMHRHERWVPLVAPVAGVSSRTRVAFSLALRS